MAYHLPLLRFGLWLWARLGRASTLLALDVDLAPLARSFPPLVVLVHLGSLTAYGVVRHEAGTLLWSFYLGFLGLPVARAWLAALLLFVASLRYWYSSTAGQVSLAP